MGLYAKLGIILALFAALFSAYKYIDYRGYQRAKMEMQQEELELAIAYANRLVEAERERNENKILVDRLSAESRRLRIHLPVCPEGQSADNQNGRAGLFSQRVDESFARLQARGTSLFERCEEINLDAIKINRIQSE